MSSAPQGYLNVGSAPSLILSVSLDVVSALCRKYGNALELAGSTDGQGKAIDGARLLWAISGCESSFGRDLKPRFEPAYFTGGSYYKKFPAVQQAIALYGRDAACSFGPWQVLAINARHSPEELGSNPEIACIDSVSFINRYVLGAEKARSLAQIGQTYNSGNWRTVPKPNAGVEKYITDLSNYYQNSPLPAAPGDKQL